MKIKDALSDFRFYVDELSLTSAGRAGTQQKKTEEKAEGNSCQGSVSALIPQECTTKIHSTVKTTADRVQDKLRLVPTALWLLLLLFLFVPICY